MYLPKKKATNIDPIPGEERLEKTHPYGFPVCDSLFGTDKGGVRWQSGVKYRWWTGIRGGGMGASLKITFINSFFLLFCKVGSFTKSASLFSGSFSTLLAACPEYQYQFRYWRYCRFPLHIFKDFSLLFQRLQNNKLFRIQCSCQYLVMHREYCPAQSMPMKFLLKRLDKVSIAFH